MSRKLIKFESLGEKNSLAAFKNVDGAGEGTNAKFFLHKRFCKFFSRKQKAEKKYAEIYTRKKQLRLKIQTREFKRIVKQKINQRMQSFYEYKKITANKNFLKLFVEIASKNIKSNKYYPSIEKFNKIIE